MGYFTGQLAWTLKKCQGQERQDKKETETNKIRQPSTTHDPWLDPELKTKQTHQTF